MQVLDGGLELAARRVIGLDGGFGLFQTCLGAGQFCFDCGNTLG